MDDTRKNVALIYKQNVGRISWEYYDLPVEGKAAAVRSLLSQLAENITVYSFQLGTYTGQGPDIESGKSCVRLDPRRVLFGTSVYEAPTREDWGGKHVFDARSIEATWPNDHPKAGHPVMFRYHVKNGDIVIDPAKGKLLFDGKNIVEKDLSGLADGDLRQIIAAPEIMAAPGEWSPGFVALSTAFVISAKDLRAALVPARPEARARRTLVPVTISPQG